MQTVLGPVVDGVKARWQALRLWASQYVLDLLAGYHDRYVAHAAHTSWHIKVWGVLSGTVLKAAMLAEYESKYDFAKRLQSLHASDRFLGTLEEGSFPKLVSALKQEHGVKLVYCWHALTGYWSGLHPGTEDAAGESGLEDLEVSVQTPIPTRGALQVEPRLSWDALTLKGVGVSSRGKMERFYDKLHSYLSSCNVDGVKVDVQATPTMLGAGRGGSAVATREMVHAMERSVSKTFGREQCINCMCHPIECLYSYQDTCVARASEDFYPNDAASHTLHVANVAYNSLFLGEIVFPDWDMFQSNNSVATLHAVARAVGGCSVYISDHPGEHDLELLKRIVLPDGSVLRALQPAKPTRDCLFADVTMDGETACKVWNRNGCGGGVVAAFNLQGSHWDRVGRRMMSNGGPDYKAPLVSASVGPKDFEAPSSQAEWAVLSTHWAVDGALLRTNVAISSYAGRSAATLAPKECAIYTFAPVSVAHSKQAEVKWAALGLENMFNAGGAILAADAGAFLCLPHALSPHAEASHDSPTSVRPLAPPLARPDAHRGAPPGRKRVDPPAGARAGEPGGVCVAQAEGRAGGWGCARPRLCLRSGAGHSANPSVSAGRPRCRRRPPDAAHGRPDFAVTAFGRCLCLESASAPCLRQRSLRACACMPVRVGECIMSM